VQRYLALNHKAMAKKTKAADNSAGSGKGQSLKTRQLIDDQYKSFLNDFQGIAYRLDPHWKPVFFHGAVTQITGYGEDDLLNLKPDWYDIVHPDDLPELKQKYQSREFRKKGFKAQRNTGS